MEKEEFNQNMMQLNLFGNKLQEIEQQLQLIDKHLSELQITSMALDELDGIKKDTDMLSPIGQNIFVKAKIQNTEKLIVDLGSKVLAEKSLEEAKEIINQKIDELSEIKEKIAEQAQAILNAINHIESKTNPKAKS